MPATYPITDWDTAYSNSGAVKDSGDFAPRFAQQAEDFRQSLANTSQSRLNNAYGDADREQYDLFSPTTPPIGLVVFVHGGYWMRFDKNYWSHLANGPLLRGWQVAIPSYTLCPEAPISHISTQIAAAITSAASENELPIRLIGHSAGGHLVSRMQCENADLPIDIIDRIEKIVSLSGVHDLRPLLKTTMNETLKLDAQSAALESPALLTPRTRGNITCWVGADELPEFRRQSGLLSAMWQGFGVVADAVAEPGKHHFNVVEGLAKHDSPLVAKLLE